MFLDSGSEFGAGLVEVGELGLEVLGGGEDLVEFLRGLEFYLGCLDIGWMVVGSIWGKVRELSGRKGEDLICNHYSLFLLLLQHGRDMLQ